MGDLRSIHVSPYERHGANGDPVMVSHNEQKLVTEKAEKYSITVS